MIRSRTALDLAGASSLAVALILHDGDIAYPAIDESASVLMVVRDPRTNSTHPNVVSVPTARVPPQLLGALWPTTRASARFGSTELLPWAPTDSRVHGSGDPVVHVVASLLSRKLGVADALESGELYFDAGVVAATTGWSFYGPDHVPQAERLTMLALLVALRGADSLPRRTASYTQMIWVPIRQMIDAVDSRDPSRLGLDAVDLCIHGLCVAAAHDVMASLLGGSPYRRSTQTLVEADGAPGRRA